VPLARHRDCRLDKLSGKGKETGRIDLQGLSPAWLIFGNGFRFGIARSAAKRTIDILASSLLIILMSPALLATVIGILIEDGIGAPVFYRQKRVGLNGIVFTVCKFRSMRLDAEKDGKPIWSTQGDSRVTRVGNVIRRLRIDELPQAFDVLSGKMSLVGPRPERPDFVRDLQQKIPFYAERHFVKPGITGWAQVCFPYGESIEDARKKLQYDLYYVKNNNPLFDLAILMQTLEIVIWGRSNAMPENREPEKASYHDELVNTSVSDTARIIAISGQPRLGVIDGNTYPSQTPTIEDRKDAG
jgi:lipopolysaccharide/colanic/teichoic acid biosynthesis glycosyltransferase